jgi:hypothetical protein
MLLTCRPFHRAFWTLAHTHTHRSAQYLPSFASHHSLCRGRFFQTCTLRMAHGVNATDKSMHMGCTFCCNSHPCLASPRLARAGVCVPVRPWSARERAAGVWGHAGPVVAARACKRYAAGGRAYWLMENGKTLISGHSIGVFLLAERKLVLRWVFRAKEQYFQRSRFSADSEAKYTN